jgi:hypothetical protein
MKGVNIMRKVCSCAIILALLIVTFSSGCSSPTQTVSTTTVTVTPSINYTTVTTASTSSATPILQVADSFTLVPFTADNEANWKAEMAQTTNINQITLPYDNYGVYESKFFFVNAGETVQIIINSNVPANDFGNEGGLAVQLRQGAEENYDSNWFKSSNVVRTSDGLTTTLVYSIVAAGDCYVSVFNNSLQNSNCQLTVNILK